MEKDELVKELVIKKKARGIYASARWLSFLCVPWFINLLFNLHRPGLFDVLFAAGVPALPYLLVIGLQVRDKDTFISSHAKQAMLIVGLRVLSAAFVAWNVWYGDEVTALGLFVLVNGGLWLFGNGRGMKQVDQGRCWWAERMNPGYQSGLSNLDLKQLDVEIARASAAQAKPKPKPVVVVEAPGFTEQAEILAEARALLQAGDTERAIAQFAEAFRLGDAGTRAEAVQELEALGAIESF